MLVRAQYEQPVYTLLDHYPSIRFSTLVLASTLPHHKHLPPDIKHNRAPAPALSFTQPNLPFLIEEIKQELLSDQHGDYQ